MSLIVCKFGGTSVASPERIQMVAKKLIAKKQAGHDVVTVVNEIAGNLIVQVKQSRLALDKTMASRIMVD